MAQDPDSQPPPLMANSSQDESHQCQQQQNANGQSCESLSSSEIKHKQAENHDRCERQSSPSKCAMPVPVPLSPRPPPLAISLSGCGFLSSYHIGAMVCFQRRAKTLLSNVDFYCGASAGALVAALLVLAPRQLEASLQQLYELADLVNQRPLGALTPGFNMAHRLAEIVDSCIPKDVSAANGRLIISVTRHKDHSNRLISTYPSRDYLLECLNATCYIPYYSSINPPMVDGERCIDGAYSNNLPVPEGVRAITVSPFSGGARIAPRDKGTRFDWQMTLGQQKMNVNIQNVVRGAQALFPPSSALLSGYYQHGYADAMHYLLKRGHYEREEGSEI